MPFAAALLIVLAAPRVALFAQATCPGGPPQPIHVSGPMRITLDYNAKPVAHARVEIDRGGGAAGDPHTVLISDEKGQVVLPRLGRGSFSMVVTAPPKLVSHDALEVSGWKQKASADLILHLFSYDPDPSLAKAIEVADQAASAKRVTAFRGVVLDESGAVIPNATVDVMLKGTGGRTHAAMLHTDGKGRFSAALPDGDYVLLFSAQGFKSNILGVTVSSGASTSEIEDVLQVGCTTH